MSDFFAAQGGRLRCERLASPEALAAAVQSEQTGGSHRIPFISAAGPGLLTLENPSLHLAVANLQAFLDEYLKQEPKARLDYIHGAAAVTQLGSKPGNIGFLLPAISKHDLFKTIILDGALPRKTFSMGEADEKRFYLECRRIRP